MAVSVGFSTTNKWISRVIRWVTRAPCSHAWIAFNIPALERRFVLQAELWGVELREWDIWQRQNIKVAEFIPIGYDMTTAVRWITQHVGAPYDLRAGFLAGISRWLKRFVRGKFSSPGRMMCSEVVVRTLQYAQYVAVSAMDPEITRPGLLLRECHKHPKEFLLKFCTPEARKWLLLE